MTSSGFLGAHVNRVDITDYIIYIYNEGHATLLCLLFKGSYHGIWQIIFIFKTEISYETIDCIYTGNLIE